MNKYLIAAIGFVVLSVQAVAALDANNYETCVKAIQSTNASERDSAMRILTQQRQMVITNMLINVNGQFPLDIRLDAARVLGNYRSIEAIESLLNNIGLEEQESPISVKYLPDGEALDRYQPICGAIEKIGSPAIPQILTRIMTDEKVDRVHKYLLMLNEIEGADVTQSRLSKLLEKETDSNKRERINLALQLLQKVKSNSPLK